MLSQQLNTHIYIYIYICEYIYIICILYIYIYIIYIYIFFFFFLESNDLCLRCSELEAHVVLRWIMQPALGKQDAVSREEARNFQQFKYSLTLQHLPWWLRWYTICLPRRRPKFNPWVRKMPWRRNWQPTPVFLPGKSLGWRSLAGCSSGGHRVVHY